MAKLSRAGRLRGGDGRHVPERAIRGGVRGYGSDTDYTVSPTGWELLDEMGVRVPDSDVR